MDVKSDHVALPNSNGVCTGTLRTRVVPGFDEPSREPLDEPLVKQKHANTQAGPIDRADRQAVNRARNERSTSLKPFRDHPRRDTTGASSRQAPAKAAATLIYTDPAPPLLSGAQRSVSRTTDQIARDLTESPLAEVTQAYTQQGKFCLPNSTSNAPLSPTPLATVPLPTPSLFHAPSPPQSRTRDNLALSNTRRGLSEPQTRPRRIKPLRF
ncbi:hypothetical protein ACM66B_003758 [Microbotryomycetes sp. NB124-2]